MTGYLASYAIESEIDLCELFPDRSTTSEWSDWSKGFPLKMQILIGQLGYRADWTGQGGKALWSLLQGADGKPHLIDWARHCHRTLDIPTGLDYGGDVAVICSDGKHPIIGPTRIVTSQLSIQEAALAKMTIEAVAAGAGGLPAMPHLWFAMTPWLGDLSESLGLPLRVDLVISTMKAGKAALSLDSIDAVDIPPDSFSLPAGLKQIDETRERRHGRAQVTEKPQAEADGANESTRTSPGYSRSFFTGTGPETVKVVFNQTLIDAIFADIRTATSYISGFNGSRFNFPTADWFGQIAERAPVPTDGTTPSVLPALMVRIFLAQIVPMLADLGLSDSNRDVEAAVAALPDSDQKRKLQAFLTEALKPSLQPAFQQLLERIVPGLGPDSPTVFDDGELIGIIIEELGGDQRFANEPIVKLAIAWYGLLLPFVNVRPRYRTRQDIEDATAVFHANGEVDIDGLAELVDINLDNFEHHISFDNTPLFTPPSYVDTAGLRTIGQLHPWLRSLQDIRFGFTTEFRLAGAGVACGVDITPTVSAATVALGLLCPPCLASLFMTGSASASVEDARFPVLIYLEQDTLRLSPPRWRIVFAEPQFGDVDASVFLIGINWILALLIDVIGNILGDFILEEILKSFGSALGDQVDGILGTLPVMDAGAFARLGRQPDQPYPPSENSVVAYEAPPRATGGYQFETFRQATSGMGSVLEFPAAGATLDRDLALVLGWERANKLRNEVTWPSYRGVFETRQPNGSVAEIDWWAEAPDQTNMPPRPPQAQSGPPPGILLIPQNVGQKWTTFGTLLHVGIGFAGWRDLTDSPADQPIGDVVVHVWCRGEAIETEIIMYEHCQDVTHLVAGLAGQWTGPGGPFGPNGPGDPVQPGGPAPRPPTGGAVGMTLSGAFLNRGFSTLDPDNRAPGPGWADNSTIGYGFGPGVGYGPGGGFDPNTGPGPGLPGRPWPDDPGPEPVPGTILCRPVVTTNTTDRETWIEASLEFRLPIYAGLSETLSLEEIANFHFLPAIVTALGETYPQPEEVTFNLAANGPLQSLDLPANRDWIRDMLLSRGTDLASLVGISTLDHFGHEYGISFLPELIPERYQPPRLLLRLESATTWPHSGFLKNIAFNWRLDQPLLGRI